jgi:hypothetical protein
LLYDVLTTTHFHCILAPIEGEEEEDEKEAEERG